MEPLLRVERVRKVYQTGRQKQAIEALKLIDFTVNAGEFVAIMGESGSGKSTLLNLLATLDQPTSGKIWLKTNELTRIPAKESATFRREHLGFVFQEFHLLDNFHVKDNILLPLVLNRYPVDLMAEPLQLVTEQLGLTDLLPKFPYELSGGQKQRVAIARALITKPELLLADEPTGALDSKRSNQLLQLFESLNRQQQTILMVTHSALAASFAQRVIFIKDGQIFHQLYRGQRNRQQFYQVIVDTMTTVFAKEG